MSIDNRLFTVSGVTTHRGVTGGGAVSERTRVRWGTDMIRLVKMLNSPGKVWDRVLGIGLAPVRVELVELPSPMTKLAALEYLRDHPEFAGADDQFLIREEIGFRQKAVAREAKLKTLTVSGGVSAVGTVAKAAVVA